MTFISDVICNMAAESDVQSEIEVLQSIYLDELSVSQKDDGGWTVSLVLNPSTAEDCLSQFVRLTLTMDLDSRYPYSSPCIAFHHPRGLSDEKLQSLQRSLQLEAETNSGTPVLYQLIERTKEILTESNIPHGNCVICLYGFQEGEAFTKTSCYHYFHSHCLGRYIKHSEKELKDREKELEKDKTRDITEEEQKLEVICPVCRDPLTYELDALLSAPAPRFSQQENAAVSVEFKKKWAALQKILERQKEKGGVIDPEAESNRFLIHITEVAADSSETVEAAGTESHQSLPASSPDCPSVNQSSQSHHSRMPAQRHCTHDRRQPAELKKGFRGRRAGPARHTIPTSSAKLVHSSSRHHVNSGIISESSAQAAEVSDNAPQLTLPVTDREEQSSSSKPRSNCEQDLSQPKADLSKDVSHTVLQGLQEREQVDRGWKHGGRGTSRHHGHWQERNFKGPGYAENTGSVGHRGGFRAREGGASHYHRGGWSHKGRGRDSHQRVDKEFKEGNL